MIHPHQSAGEADEKPTLSIIVLNYNTREATSRCLRTILGASTSFSTELILVDNASGDGSAEWFSRNYPGTRIVALDQNRGYAGGMNAGMMAGRGEFFLLVTPDVTLEHESIQKLVEIAREDESAGAVGCLLWSINSQNLDSAGGSLYLPFGIALPIRKVDETRSASPSGTIDVPFVSGALLLLTRRAFQETGGFDEEFFAYYEEVDLCLRIIGRGMRVLCTSEASARHDSKGSFGSNLQLRSYLLERNRIATNLKLLPPEYLLASVLAEPAYFLGGIFMSMRLANRLWPLAYARSIASILFRLRRIMGKRLDLRSQHGFDWNRVKTRYEWFGLSTVRRAVELFGGSE